MQLTFGRQSALLAAASVLAVAGMTGCSRPAAPERSAETIRGELIQAPASPTNQGAATGSSPSRTNETRAGLERSTAERHPAAADYFLVGFEVLAGYTYQMPDDLTATNQTDVAADQIPKSIKTFDKQPVALKGYMLPLKVEGGLVTELLIMRDQSMCCFGTVPKINEWVSVKMAREGVKPIMDQPITMLGKLRVGEMRENGYLVGIYAMDGDRLIRD